MHVLPSLLRFIAASIGAQTQTAHGRAIKSLIVKTR
jgi:hypothetical protein